MSKVLTVTDLQEYMGNPAAWNPQIAQRIVNGMNQKVDTHTARCFGEIKTVTERYDWAPAIYLRNMDIIEAPNDPDAEVTMSIKLGYPHLPQSALDTSSFFYNSYGRITMYLQSPGEFNPSAANNDLVEITYQYGYHKLGYQSDNITPVVPDDIKLACLGIAEGFYNWAIAGGKDVVATQIDSWRVQFSGSVRGAGAPTSGPDPEVATNHDKANWSFLNAYKMVRV